MRARQVCARARERACHRRACSARARAVQEATRTLAASLGAELVLVPNACAVKPEQLLQLSTRAAENVLAVAMTNYGGEPYRGLSAAYDHMGASAISGEAAGDSREGVGEGVGHVGGQGEELLMATFDIAALRAARRAPAGVARLSQPAQPSLCWPRRRDEYRRPSTFGRFT